MRPLTGSIPLGRYALLAAVVPFALLGAACDAVDDDGSPGQEAPGDDAEEDGGY